jgi:hypothetical protein
MNLKNITSELFVKGFMTPVSHPEKAINGKGKVFKAGGDPDSLSLTWFALLCILLGL